MTVRGDHAEPTKVAATLPRADSADDVASLLVGQAAPARVAVRPRELRDDGACVEAPRGGVARRRVAGARARRRGEEVERVEDGA
jgi:hypothetical protein